jgi:hypothetical protein
MAFPSVSLQAPVLSNWQFAYQGLTFGAETPWAVTGVTGMDLPTIRSGDAGRPRDQGELIGLDVLGGRDVTVNFWVMTDGNSLQSALQTLGAATEVAGSTEAPLWFQIPNWPPMALMCRPRKRSIPWDLDFGAAQVAQPVVQFHATDPRIYGPSSTALASTAAPPGVSFPVSFPASFGGGVLPNSLITVDNTGNDETRPLLVFSGPSTTPSASNTSLEGSPTLMFANPLGGTTINAGDQMVVDLDLHTVTYYVGGQGATAGASRRGWLTPGSVWWTVPPGVNTIRYMDSALSGSLEVQFAPAYMI